ncbi:MAG: 16S rRNA (cytosine(1402)-N(4))-methyltransferase RsmH [Pseudomonadota bacterium]|nr:16S rRNA (cytosine(1402)-N(4))-methyltransferase RsmH [Pseudomonadota bacterium]
MALFQHKSVFLNESIQALDIQDSGTYVDATFGRGGHSQLILEQLGPGGKLIAFDQDLDAIAYANQHIDDQRFQIIHDNFSNLSAHLPPETVHGVLMDIGVSSPQLDDATRGFSFMRDGPLDMRMDQSQQQSAFEYLMQVNEKDLQYALSVYGEERHARRIAQAIISARKNQQLKNSTQSLVDIILATGLKRDKHKHPATRSFQAIRMVVNQEAQVLELGLEAALRSLVIGGKIVVISFHGLEHRVVKAFIRKYRQKDGAIVLKALGKAQGVSYQEKRDNPRSRSAYLRVMERIK